MTDKRYADMTTIMQFCRIYTEQMYLCLKHTGMLDEGYQLRMWVGSCDDPMGYDTMKTTIELENNSLGIGTENWHKNRMEQDLFEKRGWFVHDDPRTEVGGIPPEIRLEDRTKNDMEGTGKTGTKPYPPDGFWVSSHYCPTDVDGGV